MPADELFQINNALVGERSGIVVAVCHPINDKTLQRKAYLKEIFLTAAREHFPSCNITDVKEMISTDSSTVVFFVCEPARTAGEVPA